MDKYQMNLLNKTTNLSLSSNLGKWKCIFFVGENYWR